MTSPTTIQLRTQNYIFLHICKGEITLQKVLLGILVCGFSLLLHITDAMIVYVSEWWNVYRSFMCHKTRCNAVCASFNLASAFMLNGNVTAFPNAWLTSVTDKILTQLSSEIVYSVHKHTYIWSGDISVCRRLSSNTTYVDHMLYNWFANRLVCYIFFLLRQHFLAATWFWQIIKRIWQ